ncbi:MAG: zinc-ribbon domain-containing protein [Candidatus Bathyarchaeia archaeon]|jgi:membrane protease subunit (stomatin/prohibitin family)
MTFCSHCGIKLSEEAYFCPNCGTKTQKGEKEKVKYPTDGLREAFNQAGVEIEKAFTIAAYEMGKAFQNIKEEFQNTQKGSTQQNQQTSPPPSTVTCKNCATINEHDAVFCRNCGNKLST